MNQFYQLLMVHIREFFREPAVLFWAFLFPAALAFTLGFAFRSTGAERAAIAIVPVSDSPVALRHGEALAARLEKAFSPRIMSASEADRALRRGEVRVIAMARTDQNVHFRFDLRSDDAVRQQARAVNVLHESAKSALTVTEEALSVPGSRYIDYLVPGLLAMGVMNAALWGIGWGLIGLRMKKLLRRMAASPMNHQLFFLSFAVARTILVTVEAGFLMVFAWLAFDLKPAGSPVAFVVLMLSGVFGFAGLAVAIGSRTANTQVGNGLINAATMPMMLLSGVFFSYHGFPEIAQMFIRWLPLTVLSDGLRAVYLEGAGLSESLVSAGVLVGFGAVSFTVGQRLFRWS